MFSDHQPWTSRAGRNIARAVPLLLLAIWTWVPESVLAQPAAQPAAQVPGDQAAGDQPADQASPLLIEPTTAGALFDAVV
ncbi:MAG TPA: hypothetical protein DCE47_16545, partial [Planctomycetaceae bacterium]|nr:hypothetical protein [Planctomycetaceae bacterium]